MRKWSSGAFIDFPLKIAAAVSAGFAAKSRKSPQSRTPAGVPLDQHGRAWAALLVRQRPGAGPSDAPTPTGSRVCCPFWSSREYDASSYIYSPRRYLPAGSGPGKAAETPSATGSRRHGSSLGPNLPPDPVLAPTRHKIYATEEKEHTQYVKRPAAPRQKNRSAAPAGPRASSAAPAAAAARRGSPAADADAYDDGGAAPACLKR